MKKMNTTEAAAVTQLERARDVGVHAAMLWSGIMLWQFGRWALARDALRGPAGST